MARSAFLQAIFDRPDDDGPRLVYADWLDERGDPRGEFIRVQCELAAVPACVAAATNRLGNSCTYATKPRQAWCQPCLRHNALELRSAELLTAHCREWWPEFEHPTEVSPPQIYWTRRGFLDRLECDYQFWAGVGDGLLVREPVRAVSLATEVHPLRLRAGELPARLDQLDEWEADYERGAVVFLDDVPRDRYYNVTAFVAGRRVSARLTHLEANAASPGAIPLVQLITATALAARWPGTTFTLPPVGPSPLAAAVRPYRTAQALDAARLALATRYSD